jgi:hypothetical protein
VTPEEIINVLREVDADAKSSEGDYYADQFAWHGAGEIADAVEQMAAEIARLREERRWVPVGERLPEGNCKVLTLGLQRYPVVCSFFQFDQSFRDGGVVSGVTNWMPLPPGPEANG